jgi:hypothetical protein
MPSERGEYRTACDPGQEADGARRGGHGGRSGGGKYQDRDGSLGEVVSNRGHIGCYIDGSEFADGEDLAIGHRPLRRNGFPNHREILKYRA